MKLSRFIICAAIVLSMSSCINYYNNTIKWADNLKDDWSIDFVKSKQPYYVEIDWDNPRIIDNQQWYLITKIKGNNDILGMSHYLVFINNKYQYRESKK